MDIAKQNFHGGPLHHQIVYQSALKLVTEVLQRTANFHKGVRPQLGGRMEGLALDCFLAINQALFKRQTTDKIACLEQADLQLDQLKALVQCGFELRLLGHPGTMILVEIMQEVGMQIGGMLKNYRQRLAKNMAFSTAAKSV